MVDTPMKGDGSLAPGHERRHVAGPIEPPRRLARRRFHEAFRGQVGAAVVAERQTLAADVKLADDAFWNRVAVAIRL